MHEDAPTVEAPVRAVTVYRSGAVVQREASLPGNTAAVVVSGLPLCLDDASLSARVAGPGAPAVTGVRVALAVTDVELPDPPEQQALDAARLEEARAQAAVALLKQRAEELATLQSPDQPGGRRGEAPPAVPLSARLALLDFQQARLADLDAALSRARDALRDAREARVQLEDAWRRATTARPPRAQELRKAAWLSLLGGDAGQGPWTLELSYLVPGARWTPSYSLRFDAALAEVQVELRAAVAQRTGEDWRGARLTVSTAHPLTWTALPELPALRIGRRQPRPPRTGWRPAPEGADALYADYRAAVARLPVTRPVPRPSAAIPPSAVRAEEPVGGAAFAVSESAPAAGEVEVDALDLAMDDAPALESRAKRARGRGPVMRSAAMAMPPPAPSAPAPQATAMLSRSVPGGAPAQAAAYGGGGAPADGVGPAEPEELAAPEALLDYGRLRLAGPDAPSPGALQPASRLELYQERVSVQRVTIDQRALGLVDEARRRADLSGLALPPGHVHPAPIRDFDHAWSAEHPVDLDSDGTWHTLSLVRGRAPAQRRYVVVPREAREVFRTASFANPLETPLPTGPADVYVGGELLLTAPLRAADRGGRVRLGLGVEQGLEVARNTRFRERSSGLLSTTLALEHEVDVEVANQLSRAAEVEVRERLPTRRKDDEEIEITAVRTEPPWEAWEQEQRPVRGSHRWVVEVPPGGRRELKLRYTVEISGKKELVGGNRREG